MKPIAFSIALVATWLLVASLLSPPPDAALRAAGVWAPDSRALLAQWTHR